MRTYRFGRDPLCWGACFLYAFNRWGVRPHVHNWFIEGYFNDLLLLPAALPWVLWFHDWAGWRSPGPPTFGEVALHWGIWSLLCEGVGPRLWPHGVADPWDVAAYAAGALVSYLWWRRWGRMKPLGGA